jgi:hypothetical protein
MKDEGRVGKIRVQLQPYLPALSPGQRTLFDLKLTLAM